MPSDLCEYCHGVLPKGSKRVTVYRNRRGQHFIFERVPARVCRRCGERYFGARVVREMDRLMKKRKPVRHLTPVPVIEWRASA